jgi:glycosyltransferase involved in cell wall biosynthesis
MPLLGDRKLKKVLLSAYACLPDSGSEPGVGWNWAIGLSRFFDVFVVTKMVNKESIDKYLSKHNLQNLHFVYFDFLGSKIRLKNKLFEFWYCQKWERKILKPCRKLVEKENIDIIFHSTFCGFRNHGFLYKINRPFLWGPVGGGQLFKKKYSKALFRKKDLLKEVFRNGINLLIAHFSLSISKIFKLPSKSIIIADNDTADLLARYHHFSYIKLLDTGSNNFQEKIHYNFESCIQLLYVGKLIPRKGLKLLIDALGKSSFRSFHLTIVGSGLEREKLIKLSHLYGIESLISFVGEVSHSQVMDFYRKSNIFVFPSIRDTSGSVILEAMSQGLPVIAIKQGGAISIIDINCGKLIDGNTYEEICSNFVNAITGYANNRQSIIAASKAAIIRAQEFSWDRKILVMKEEIDRLLKKEE